MLEIRRTYKLYIEVLLEAFEMGSINKCLLSSYAQSTDKVLSVKTFSDGKSYAREQKYRIKLSPPDSFF